MKGNRRMGRSSLTLALCSALVGNAMWASAPMARGQQQAGSEAASNEQLLADFLHYVQIRNDELAIANARALLERGLRPVEFVGLVEDSRDGVRRFEQTVRLALSIPALEGHAGALWRLYEDGKRAQSRDPEEIARSIAMLDGPARGRLLARERLRSAREYAVPQLLQVLQAQPNPLLEAEVTRLLRDMGSDAVAPLTAALLRVDPPTQERICEILGGIASEVSVPYLLELIQVSPVASVQGAARRALLRITGSADDTSQPLSDRYQRLAERYYAEQQSLTRFPDESHQLLWTFDPGFGLFPTPVRTETFHEMRAMEIAGHAIELDASNDNAVSLWIASNLRREIQSPPGWANPAYPASRPGAMYYAVAGGSKALQPVLARALDEKDTRLARSAIAALSRSAGGATLWEGVGVDKPLVRALLYPDRRVQIDAALALARANPPDAFDGAERVVPILAAAAADAAKTYALILATSEEDRQDLQSLAMELGYTSLAPAASLSQARRDIADAPAVDMILMRLGSETQAAITGARLISKLKVAPIIAQTGFTIYNELTPRYSSNPLVNIVRDGVAQEQLATAVLETAIAATGPPITGDEAAEYTQQALEALLTLARTRSEAFDVREASGPLLAALHQHSGATRLLVADVLARINQRRAQVAIMDAAINAQGQNRVALLERVAMSVRKHGGLLDRTQLDWLVDTALVSEDEGVATAAAALMGSLNMPELQVAPLIIHGA